MRTLTRLSMVGLLVLPLMGCGDDGGGGTAGSSSTSPTSLSALLAFVPDTESSRGVVLYYSNIAALRGARTSASGDEDLSLLRESSGGEFTMSLSVAQCMVEGSSCTSMLGFDSRNLDATLDFGTMPDDASVLAGRFDTAQIEAALRSAPQGDTLQSSAPADGVVRFSLGGTEYDPMARTGYRPIGEPLRFDIGDGWFVFGGADTVNDAILSTRAGGPSLAADAGFAAVAGGLDAAGVHQAFLLEDRWSNSWQVVGAGEVFNGATSTLVMVLTFADAAAASAGAERLRANVESGSNAGGEPWSDSLSVIDVRVDGTTVIGTFTSNDPGVATNIIIRLDPILEI